MAKKTIPKYVLRALDRRERYAQKLLTAVDEINRYCAKIGLDPTNDRYDEAVLGSHVIIFLEPEIARENTLAEIERILQEVSE